MSKFNTRHENIVTNLAGGDAYQASNKLAFISLLLSSFLEDKYYESGSAQQNRLKAIIDTEPDKFWLCKATLYARHVFGMRSVTHASAAYLAEHIRGQKWAKEFFQNIVARPDDMGEIIAVTGKFPNAMKKGFCSALEGMNEYQLGKYAGDNKDWKLVDIVNCVHPRKNTEAIGKLLKGELKPDTWEVLLSEAGKKENKEQAKCEVWEKLLNEDKLGYLALLRNLRNIDAQAPESLPIALQKLTDKERVLKSKVFPFQFVTALQNTAECSAQRAITIALSQAIEHSLANVPKLDGKTLVVVDVSGSMSGRPSEIASLFASVLVKANEGAELMTFADNAQYVPINPLDSVVSIARSFSFASGGTNFNAIFETANKAYDRVIILSDMQAWVGGNTPKQAFAQYRSAFSANPKIYSFDLNGHGTLEFPEDNVYALAGWSDKVLQLMGNLENDRSALIHAIDTYEI